MPTSFAIQDQIQAVWQRLNKQSSSFILLQYVKSCENTGALKIRMLIQKWFHFIVHQEIVIAYLLQNAFSALKQQFLKSKLNCAD